MRKSEVVCGEGEEMEREWRRDVDPLIAKDWHFFYYLHFIMSYCYSLFSGDYCILVFALWNWEFLHFHKRPQPVNRWQTGLQWRAGWKSARNAVAFSNRCIPTALQVAGRYKSLAEQPWVVSHCRVVYKKWDNSNKHLQKVPSSTIFFLPEVDSRLQKIQPAAPA